MCNVVRRTQSCSECGYRTDFEFYDPDFTPVRTVFDCSSTYDNFVIVSLKFKEFCVRHGYTNIEFRPFAKTKKFYWLVAKNEVEFDSQRSKTRFMDYCEACGNYESVVGVTPAFLKGIDKPLADGFYRTDLAFGGENAKTPVTIIGVETYEKMKKEKFKGIDYDPIDD